MCGLALFAMSMIFDSGANTSSNKLDESADGTPSASLWLLRV